MTDEGHTKKWEFLIQERETLIAWLTISDRSPQQFLLYRPVIFLGCWALFWMLMAVTQLLLYITTTTSHNTATAQDGVTTLITAQWSMGA